MRCHRVAAVLEAADRIRLCWTSSDLDWAPGAALRRRPQAQDQRGMVLAFVMGTIALTSVLVVALLGLVLTSARVADEQARLALEARAADGALEVAVETIAARTGDPCDGVQLDPIAFEGRGSPVDVEVTCLLSVPPTDPQADLPGPDVEVVGTGGYTGSLPAPTVAGVGDPTLVWDGEDQPLRFNADVRVNGGAAPVRRNGNPAIEIAGQYTQRQPFNGGCGPLATEGPHQIRDFSGEPACGPEVNAVSAQVAEPSLGPGSSGLPRCGELVTVAAGRWTRDQVEAFNDAVGPACSAPTTVVLAPGVHVVDVYDRSDGRTGDGQFILQIANPNAQVIGGEPSGRPFPRACRTDTDGVTIQLSGRSAFRHTDGRVALCPRWQGTAPLPVIEQTDRLSGPPQLVGVSAAGFANPERLGRRGDLAEGELRCYLLQQECSTPSFTTRWSVPGTSLLRSAALLFDQQQTPEFILGGRQSPWSYHEEPIRAGLSVTGAAGSCDTGLQPIGRSFGGRTALNLLSGTCVDVLRSESDLDGASVTVTFSFPAPTFTTVRLGIGDVRLELNAHRVDATAASGPAWDSPDGALGPGGAAATVSQPSAECPTLFGIPCPPSTWETFQSNPIRGQEYPLVLFDLGLPTGTQPSDPVSDVHVRMRARPADPNVVTDPADGTLVRFAFRTADGRECATSTEPVHHRSQVQSTAELRYDLLADGDCAEVLRTFGDLDGGSLTATFRTGCTGVSQWWGVERPSRNPGDPSQCRSVKVPVVDDLGLVARSDVVRNRPPSSTITVRTTPGGSGPGASFDVFGPVLLPRTDLEVNWSGGHFARPLFGGRLQVHGLGSRQVDGASVGVVCCNPYEGTGVLEARIDGVTRARAVVRVDATAEGSAAAPRRVAILDWQLCGRSGCDP